MLFAVVNTNTEVIAFWSLEARSSLNCRPALCLGHPNIISSSTLSAMKNLQQFIILDTLRFKGIIIQVKKKFHYGTVLK